MAFDSGNCSVRLSECIFENFNAVILLVDTTFVFYCVNTCAPITVLSAGRFVPFSLQMRWELVIFLNLLNRAKGTFFVIYWLLYCIYYLKRQGDTISLSFLGRGDIIRVQLGRIRRWIGILQLIRNIHHFQFTFHDSDGSIFDREEKFHSIL